MADGLDLGAAIRLLGARLTDTTFKSSYSEPI
jgi:hypothetical protein